MPGDSLLFALSASILFRGNHEVFIASEYTPFLGILHYLYSLWYLVLFPQSVE
jgi:hypothetical protein